MHIYKPIDSRAAFHFIGDVVLEQTGSLPTVPTTTSTNWPLLLPQTLICCFATVGSANKSPAIIMIIRVNMSRPQCFMLTGFRSDMQEKAMSTRKIKKVIFATPQIGCSAWRIYKND
jgi:hypothetical protein